MVLGIGNLLYANNKINDYLLAKTRLLETSEAEKSEKIPILNHKISLSRKEEHLNKIQARLQFYYTVQNGGKFFLALSGISLLAFLLIKPTKLKDQH